jgi:aryl-alcohol dehydrogenase-like predicted oxidoreductase
MEYAKLGKTGLDCSRLGFGTWQVGGGRWKALQHAEAVALLRHAADCGINIFDAASVYGQYRGEVNERRSRALELLGEAFSGKRREEVLICLKLGQVDEFSHRAVYYPRNLVQELQGALRALRTDYVDICLIHAPSLSEVRAGCALAVTQTIQAMGVVKFVGYSFDAEPEHARLALNQEIDVMMLQYNLLDEECAETFGLAHDKGIGMLVCGPYKRGYLSGRFDKPEDLPLEDNYWAWNLRYNRGKVESILTQASQLKQEAGGARQLRKRALNHILRHPGATVAVVGHRSPEEVADNVQLMDEILACESSGD